MEVKVKAKYLRNAPRKVRLIADLVRGMKLQPALDQLRFSNKKAAQPVTKLINSAVATAKNDYELDENNLYIKAISVDGGPIVKRWMPRAFGRATPIRKRTSHVNLVLAEIKDSGLKQAKKQKLEKPTSLTDQPAEQSEVKGKKPKQQKPEDKNVKTGAKNQAKGDNKMFRRKSA